MLFSFCSPVALAFGQPLGAAAGELPQRCQRGLPLIREAVQIPEILVLLNACEWKARIQSFNEAGPHAIRRLPSVIGGQLVHNPRDCLHH